MPCQCGSQTVASNPAAANGCECATESAASCECGTGGTGSLGGSSLERIVMELDKRVRKLEARE